MDVCVAIRAIVTDIREHKVRVALCTSNTFMHATQWIARFVVIKFRNVANGLPAGERVAVLALNIQRPVWAARSFPLIRWRR